MQVVGYCIYNKQFVAFDLGEKKSDRFKITDGFHDKNLSGQNKDYRWVKKENIDLEKIIRRLHGTRPWHPLLSLLEKEKTV